MSTPHTQQDSTGLYYGDRGAGTTIVLLHAFPLDRRMWDEQANALSENYRVITPDALGFGGSDLLSADWSMSSCADRLAKLLDNLAISEPIILGGLSMGGYIALALARQYPDRIRGLILADTRADADSPETSANRGKTIAAMATQTAADLIDQMLPKMLSDTTRNTKPWISGKVRELASHQSREGIIAGLKALRDRSDSTGNLKGFNFPVLVIVGAEDAITPPSLAEAMVKELPNASLELIPQAGHLSNLEMPELFMAAINGWLKRIV